MGGVTADTAVTDYALTTTGEVDRVVAADPYGSGVVYTGLPAVGDKILQEDSDFILLEANGYILLEG